MKTYLPSLHGLRAISILLVIASHLEMYVRHEYFIRLPKATGLLYDGQLGVTVFFVISGYLITILLLQEERITGTVSLRNFYMRRTLRIFPAFYFLLLIYFAFQQFGLVDIPASSWLSALTYTKYFNWNRDMLTGHAWSLSIEEQFYLLWPFVFCFWKTARKKFAILIVAAVPLVRGVFYLTQFGHAGFDDLSLFQRMDALMWGCLFALYKKEMLRFVQKLMRMDRRLAMLPFLLLAALFYLDLANLNFHLRIGVLLKAFGQTIGTLSCCAIGLIVLISIYYRENAWFDFLNAKPLVYLGKLSYSLYLWQQFFLFSPAARGNGLALNCLYIFGAANFSYYLVERPFLKWKSNFKSERKPVKKRALVEAYS